MLRKDTFGPKIGFARKRSAMVALTSKCGTEVYLPCEHFVGLGNVDQMIRSKVGVSAAAEIRFTPSCSSSLAPWVKGVWPGASAEGSCIVDMISSTESMLANMCVAPSNARRREAVS